MTELIVPVKPLTNAKQRLAGVLSPLQRAQLVLAMLDDLLETVSSIPNLSVWVVSNDPDVCELTTRRGIRVIDEPKVEGYNSAVAIGIQAVGKNSGNNVNVAIVPADIPFASYADLALLTEPVSPDVPSIRLVPSHDECGTNGVFMSSGDLVSPSFGENSFARHRSLSERASLIPEILSLSSLAFDIDTPVDLDRLRNNDAPGATGFFMRSLTDNNVKNAFH